MTSTVPVSSKLPDIGVSIFAVQTRLANEHKAINLSQGFPDFDCEPALVEAVAKAMRGGHNQYAPMPGVLALREGIAAKVERLYGPKFDPITEVVVTSGATAGLFATLTTFVQPGDEVILFEPCYDSYVPVIRLSGGTPGFVSLRYPELRDRAVVISSFGKTFHTTGWKVGYCVGPQPLVAEVIRVHQFMTFTVHTPSQVAFAEFVRKDPTAKNLTPFYQRKRDVFLELTAGSRFRPLPCAGTYFQLFDYSGISKEKDKEIAHRLIVEHGVASIPVSAFLYKDPGGPVLRFCFAKKDETLSAAAERLRRV